jgi:hypothetical protein
MKQKLKELEEEAAKLRSTQVPGAALHSARTRLSCRACMSLPSATATATATAWCAARCFRTLACWPSPFLRAAVCLEH